jgi:hypothetical protein
MPGRRRQPASAAPSRALRLHQPPAERHDEQEQQQPRDDHRQLNGTRACFPGGCAALAGTFLAFLLAAALGLVLIGTRRAGRESHLPLGPFILIGVLAAVAL